MADRLAELVDVRLASAGVALVTLNLPQVRNAMTTELTAAWTTAMDKITGDRSLRAVVVTGAGSAFCAGADLSWLDQGNLSDNTPDRLRDKMLPFYRAWLAPQQIPVPVVAAVNGSILSRSRSGVLSLRLPWSSQDSSAPEQNALPAPVTTTARSERSPATLSMAVVHAAVSSVVIAFRT